MKLTSSQQRSKDSAHDPDFGQLPLYRRLCVRRIVVGNGDGSQVSEQSDEDDEIGSDGLVEDDHGDSKVDLKM